VEVEAAQISAVIRSWEERFGAVVVLAEPGLAILAITAPPTTAEQGLAVAAEHFAFCPPETVEPGTLEQLASILVGQAALPGAERFPPTLSTAVWPVGWYD
jgi:hypothetical protein